MPRSFGTSAQFSRELLDASLVQGMELVKPHLAPLITTVQLGNGQGNYAKYIVLGNESEPHELYGTPIEKFDRIGTYAFSMAPIEYADGIMMTDSEIADATSPEWLAKAQARGAKVPQFLEKRLAADIMESATLFDGFDGQPLYSATHTWGTSDQTPGDPAPTYTTSQSNLITAGSGGTDYASTTAVLDDFYQATAAMNGWKDDKGTAIHSGEGQYYIVYNNLTAGLDRWLNLTFNPDAMAGDDTARDGLRFKVKLIPSPHFTATAGTSDYDWYLFKLIPGQQPPLVIQERQGIQSETWRDPGLKMNYWQYTIRYGFGWTNWWQTIKVNKA